MASNYHGNEYSYNFPPLIPEDAGLDIIFSLNKMRRIAGENRRLGRNLTRKAEIEYGEEPSPESKALLLLDDNVGRQVFRYFVNNFLQQGLGEFVALRRRQIQEVSTRASDVTSTWEDRLQGAHAQFLQITSSWVLSLKTYSSRSPYSNLFIIMPQGAIQIDEFGKERMPLKPATLQKVDALFDNAIGIEDMGDAVFFSYLDRISEAEIDQFVMMDLPEKRRHVYAAGISYRLKQLRLRVKEYLSYYHRQLEEGTLKIDPQDKSILPVVIASTLLFHSNFFPSSVAYLLESAFSKDLAEVIEVVYEDRYIHSLPNRSLSQRERNQIMGQYNSYWQTFQSDRLDQTLLDIEKELKLKEVGSDQEELDDVIIHQLMSCIGKKGKVLGNLGDMRVALGVSVPDVLDILLTLPDDRTACIQVVRGRVIVPSPEFARTIQAAIFHFSYQFPFLHPETVSSSLPASTPKRNRHASRPLAEPIPLPRKRKAQRVTSGQQRQITGSDNTQREIIAGSYTANILRRYRDALVALSPASRKAAQDTLNEWIHRKKRAKRLVMSNDAEDISIYSLRPDDVVRIILVHLKEDPADKFYVFDIGPRNDDIIYKRIGKMVRNGAIRRIIEKEKQRNSYTI